MSCKSLGTAISVSINVCFTKNGSMSVRELKDGDRFVGMEVPRSALFEFSRAYIRNS
jgi:hypothetical protein